MSNILAYLFLKVQAITLLVFGRKLAALERFDAMLALAPSSRYVMASRAHLLGDLGDQHGAVDALVTLTSAHPENSAGWFNLGYMLADMGRHAEAEPAFRRAIRVEPKMDRAWYGLALVLIRDRRFDEAAEALKKNTELQPMSPFGWYLLARVHVDQQQPAQALRIIRHLHGFEPKVAAQLERETGLFTAQALCTLKA